jgi:hypothetical protein
MMMDAKKKSLWLKILAGIGLALGIAGTIVTGGSAAPFIAAGKVLVGQATAVVNAQPETTEENK